MCTNTGDPGCGIDFTVPVMIHMRMLSWESTSDEQVLCIQHSAVK